MGTGISRFGVGLVALGVGLAGCGAGSGATGSRGTGSRGAGSAGGGGFSWLHAQPPPAGWRVATIPSGATMAYPPNWRRQHSDAGTATAVLQDARGHYVGYVNLTPRQGNESLADWSSFRLNHNSDEGDRNVNLLATGSGLRFLTGRGSCVEDSYSTVTGARFVEVACLVTGRHAASVIVAAAPPQAWSAESRALERDIEAVRS